jgi:hypothetical protein
MKRGDVAVTVLRPHHTAFSALPRARPQQETDECQCPFLELGLKGIVGQVIQLPRRREGLRRHFEGASHSLSSGTLFFYPHWNDDLPLA